MVNVITAIPGMRMSHQMFLGLDNLTVQHISYPDTLSTPYTKV